MRLSRLIGSAATVSLFALLMAGCGDATEATPTSNPTGSPANPEANGSAASASDLLGARITATTAGPPGAVVQAVQPASATLLRRGDVILAVNGIRVSSAADVGAAMGAPELGKKLTLRVVRGSHRITLLEIPSPTTYLGAKVRDLGGRGQGAVVVAVASQGPADLAKLKPGDLITAVEGTRIENVGDLLEAIGVHHPGEQVSLTVSRGSRELHLSATLARRPS